MPDIHHLIADPSPAVQTFIRNLLESYGFDAGSVSTASTPHTALELAATVKPDFLITDWFGKGGMNGIDLHEAVVQHSPACALAIMATAPSGQQRVDADMAGAYFLLAKPFTADECRGELAKAMAELAKKHPHIAKLIPAAPTREPAKPPKIVLPDLPQYKPGDQVSYQNRRESVKHVILRRGELVVQLHGVTGLVEATKLKHM